MNSPHPDGVTARADMVRVLTRIAKPVLTALSEGQLKTRMPVEVDDSKQDRSLYSHLEAIGRLMAGLAPWLELGADATEEGQLRERFIHLATKAIANAVDPDSPDYLNFKQGIQPLMDASFLCLGLLRAPVQIWGNLSEKSRAQMVTALKITRAVKPHQNNWMLSPAVLEAALWKFTGECRMAPITRAVNSFSTWYKGDGTYGDGPFLHWDYYNSYAIHPMLFEVVRVCQQKGDALGQHFPTILERTRRYAAVQERLISPEATFPVVGRSSCYRFGALQTLSLMAIEHQLPAACAPASVRAALTAVVRRMIEAPGTFDAHGWLRVGVVGSQPSHAEPYISTGSLYLCSTGLLHLGLPANDPLWTGPDQPWTQKRIWAGEDVLRDGALDDGPPKGFKTLVKKVAGKLLGR